jgi:ribosomal RNA-processing protein 36
MLKTKPPAKATKTRFEDTDDSDSDPPEDLDIHPQHKRPRVSTDLDEDFDDSLSYDDSEDNAPSSSDDSDDDNHPNYHHTNDDIPLGDIVQVRHDGSTDPAAMKRRAIEAKRAEANFKKRETKHRPVEKSSKRPVPIFRDSFQASKPEIRDPRFDTTTMNLPRGGRHSGDPQQQLDKVARKRYSFLFEQHLPAEQQELKTAIKRTNNPHTKSQLQAQLTKISQSIKEEDRRRRSEQLDQEIKSKEVDAVKAGKKPYYLKKSEKKRIELLAKYEDLKSSGKLEKYMEKRRKKVAAKDHRYLPTERR